KEKGPFDPGRLIHVSRQACWALSDAHSRGMVHRDLKPSNILLTKRGGDPLFVKLVDFGLVKDTAPDPTGDLTRPGVLIGSPNYAAPEQVLSKPITPETDVYGLGGVMYFMATGVPPFQRNTEFQILRAHVQEPPIPPRKACPKCQIGKKLEKVI